MEKKNSARIRAYNRTKNIIAGIGLFVLGFGISLSLTASAATTHIDLPEATAVDRVVRDIESSTIDLSEGVDIGENIPTGTPGAPTGLPVPNFSMVNTSAIVNETGPVEIPDDVRIYGLTEVIGGLINNGGEVTVVAPPVPPPASTPDLYVAKSADSPTCDNVAKGSTGADAAKLDLFAPDTAIRINSIILTRSGTATAAELTHVTLYDADLGIAIASNVPVDGPTSNKYTASIAGGLLVPVGATKHLLVKVKTAAGIGTGKTFSLGIQTASDITAVKSDGSKGTASGTFPAKGNDCTVGSGGVPPGGEGVVAGDELIVTYDESGTANPNLIVGQNTLIQFGIKTASGQIKVISITAVKNGSMLNSNIIDCELQRFSGGSWSAIPNSKSSFVGDQCNIRIDNGNGVNASTTEETWRIASNLLCQTGGILAIDVRVGGIGVPAGVTVTGLQMSTSPRTAANCPAAPGGVTIPTPPPSTKTLYNPNSTQSRPIALFGSFIPAAHAEAGAGDASDLLHPVTVYDDLYVYGNSDREPGNIVISGHLRAGQADETSQISGNLQIIGDLTVADNATVRGDLTVSGTLGITGALTGTTINATTLTANTIGAFYKLTDSADIRGSGTDSVYVTCGTGDILLSCSGRLATSNDFEGTNMNGLSCTAYGIKRTATKTLKVQAVCFNPNGDTPSSYRGTLENL